MAPQSSVVGAPASKSVPFVSVVIPTFRRPEETALAVASVAASAYPAERLEIIVVDTSPDDATRESIAPLEGAHPGRVRLLKKPVAEGPGASRNLGARTARGDILAFTDSDCQVDPDWLAEGVEPFARNPKLGIVQGRTLPNPRHPRGAASRFMQVEAADCVYAACNVFFRRQAFDAVGGYSPDFDYVPNQRAEKPALFRRLLNRMSVVHFHALLGFDVDLAWRVLESGWTSTFQSGALVYHAVTPLTPWQWMMEGAYYAYAGPPMVKRHPGLRRHMYARYFASKTTALFTLSAIAVLLAATVHWVALLLCLPYAVHRNAERSRVWRGILRPLRFLVYVPRDSMSVLFSVIASVRAKTLLV